MKLVKHLTEKHFTKPNPFGTLSGCPLAAPDAPRSFILMEYKWKDRHYVSGQSFTPDNLPCYLDDNKFYFRWSDNVVSTLIPRDFSLNVYIYVYEDGDADVNFIGFLQRKQKMQDETIKDLQRQNEELRELLDRPDGFAAKFGYEHISRLLDGNK